MFNIFGGLFVNSGVKFIADFFSVIFGMFGRTFVNLILNLFAMIVNFFTKYLWLISKWVLGILDAMQFGFTRILGIDTSTKTTLSLGDIVEGAKDVIMPGGSNYYDHLMKIFRAAFGVAIVLMIIFTVVAMVIQEYKLSVNGYEKADNKKGKFVKVLFANIITIFLIPLIFYTIIAGSSAILTSIYRAFGTSSDVTIAGNVLAAATYDANRYRAYANADKRIPITISVYSMENVFGGTRSDAELMESIEDPEVQEKLKAIGGAFANDSFLPFKKSTIYENGAWANYENYSLTYNNTVYDDLGQYFENFICTREQYYIMADFIDYCQLYNIKYYVKAMSESDICWKYVDGLTVDADIDDKGNALGDITLNVKYRDAAEINMENGAVAAGADDGSYSLQITTKVEYSSPISDALTTASKLLGIDKNSSKFNTMERDDSGDFENLVSWSTEKVLLKTSTNFDLKDPSSWIYSDQVIVYEYFRFEESADKASNNTLRNYTIADFANGVELDALKLTYRNFNSNTGSYSDEKDLYCVKLNGSYYRVAPSDQNFDSYGHPYYMLAPVDKNVDFFIDNSTYTIKIKHEGTTSSIRLSSGFDINDIYTVDNATKKINVKWNIEDQILVYEYFKDLSLSNDLVRKYKLSDLKAGSGVDVEFNKFSINGTSYVYINGTYYQLDGDTFYSTSGLDFLIDTFTASQRHFGYKLSVADSGRYGIANLNGLAMSDPYGDFTEIDDTDAMYQKYSSMNFRLSEDFSIYNSDTWSFRDYAIIYLYVNYLMVDKSMTVDTLKHLGLQGNFGRIGTEYCMQVKYVDSTDNNEIKFVLFHAEGLSRTSELKITQTLSPDIFDNMNLGLNGVNLVTTYNQDLDSDRLIMGEVSTQKFELSENFDAYDPVTWTIGDYLMIYLTNSGVIDTDIGIIKVLGYTSLVYNIGTEANPNNYYRFGREGDENAFFLSEQRINEAGYDVDKWFNTDLMSFLLTKYYSSGTNELLYDDTNFGGGAYINKDTYILNIGGEVTSTRNLQYRLAKDLFEKGLVSSDIKKLQYSYANPEINKDDIRTWKYLDLMIYQRTGTVPTLSEPYTSYVYNNGNGYWLLVEDLMSSENDIFVNISTSHAKCYSPSTGTPAEQQTPYTVQIRSDSQRKFSTKTDYNKYCADYLTTIPSVNITGISAKTAYYYSTYLKGDGTSVASFKENEYMTDMDMVLINDGGVLTSTTGYFTFETYEVDGYLYARLPSGSFIGLDSDKYAKIYHNANFLVPSTDTANVFSLTSSYTSFGTTKNMFDALLYSLTGSTESVVYDVYSFLGTGNRFIKVNNEFVYLNSSMLAYSLPTNTYIEENLTLYINYLYENFYHSAVSFSSPVVSSRYSGQSLSISDVWHTAVRVILSYHELVPNSENSEVVVSVTNEKYLHVTYNGKSVYINLSGIADASWSYVGDSYRIVVSSTDAEMTLWRAYNTQKVLNPITGEYHFVAQSPDFLRNREELVGTNVKNVSELSSNIDLQDAASNLSTHDMGKYTYQDLFKMFFDPQRTYQKVNTYYTIESNPQPFVVYQNFDEQYVVPKFIKYTSLDGGSVSTQIGHYIEDKMFVKQTISSVDAESLKNSDTVLGKVLYQNNFNAIYRLTSNFLQDENGDALVVYIVQNESAYYAIYGLKNESLSSIQIEYKYVIDSTSVGNTDVESEAEIFIVSTRDMKDLKSWTMVDFAMSYLTGDSYGSFFGSNIYVYDNKNYVKKDDRFMLIPFNSVNENIFKANTESEGFIDTNGSTKLIDLLRIGGSAVGFLDRKGELAEALQLTNFENTKLAEQPVGEPEHIKFSENFNIRDFSTWTISDYVLYYVVTNDFYDNGAQLQIPFTYVPNFMTSNMSIYNLTYFDMFLADFLKVEDGAGNVSYPYLTEESYRNQAYTFNIVRDGAFNYYVMLNGGYYVKLSDYVYTNYEKMEIRSAILGDTFLTGQISAVTAKIIELETQKTSTLAGGAFPMTAVIEGKNFQTLANAHGALGQIHYLLKQDENTGSVEFDKVIEFNTNSGESGTYFKYKKFYEFYGSSFADYTETNKENELDITISTLPLDQTDYPVSLVAQYTQVYPDLEFKNYFYFNEFIEKIEENSQPLIEKNEVIQAAILEGGSSFEKAKVNLKLSTVFNVDANGNKTYVGGFRIEDVSTWTVIDYLIMREFAREGVNHNKFKDMTFEELYEPTYANIYISGPGIYLYLNGNFYNLNGVVSLVTGADAEDVIYESNGTKVTTYAPGLVEGKSDASSPNINKYNFRVLKETVELSINPVYVFSTTYTRSKDNVAYETEETDGVSVYVYTNFKYVDTDTVDENYRINVSRFGTYSTETLIKKSSWVEKLMTDMQVFYPDLNWGTLIATDGWLDTLGEFTSAYTNGLFTGGNNSSNTTAAGLVLSEFFMSVAKEVDDSYADYEYSSAFDEKTLQALMLSLMGEENYKALVLEAEVFMDYFNSSFAPIIDDFAKEFGESVGDNSLRLCAYKSYLATVLLSSDIGEYLYTIATRIYAEYTIGEYLANAGNDYSSYYSYVNNLKDENGNVIDAFNYGSFKDLIKYENEYCGSKNPTFTFNIKKAFDVYKDEDNKINGFAYDDYKANEYLFDLLITTLIEKIDEDYSRIYLHNYQVTEDGQVVNELLEPVSSYSGEEYVYCYMIHVYWSINYSISYGAPSYLQCYSDYIHGKLSRWSIISGLSTDGADMYFEEGFKEKSKMILYKGLTFANCVRLYVPTIVLGGNDKDENILEKIWALVENILDNPLDAVSEHTVIPYSNAYDMLSANNNVLKKLKFINEYAASLWFIMGFSEDSSFEILDIFEDLLAEALNLPADITNTVASWNKILEFNDCLEAVIGELQLVRDLLPGESTDGGSDRYMIDQSTGKYYTNDQIDKVITSFQDLKYNITQYITSQSKIDRMQKRSITFTLGQYGNNYVSSGFNFTVRNKEYTFKNTIDPSRIAEYVYGGAFLESVGVGAQYTSPEFTGIIRASKVYDNVDKVLKTNLDSWPTLRGFASNLADKTAELYFLTNLGDLNIGNINGVKVDSVLNGNTTIADKIALFIKDQFRQNLDDTSTPEREDEMLIERIGDDFKSLSLYLFSNSITEEDLDNISFEDYKRMVLKKVIENEQNQEESAEERANKYMTLFNLLGLQFDLSTGSGPSYKALGRIIRPGNILGYGVNVVNDSSTNNNGEISVVGDIISPVAAISGQIELSAITATAKYSNATIDIIKTMSGLENRPTFEVLTREYSGLKPTDYYDEAYGDTFIICTYKNGLYYPILVSGSKQCSSANYNRFYSESDPDNAILKHKFISEYSGNNVSESYVIVAKGVVTADGYPTAIRKYNNPIEIARKKLLSNQVDTYNAVTYYRTNVGGNFGSGEDLVSASRAVTRVTTKNYTKYVYGTNFTSGIGGTTTYTGKTNLKTLVKSDFESNFVQSKVEYLISDIDSFGGISVLDEFSYFYVLGGQSWIILLMAFITIIPVMINAIGGVMTRVFDLVILFLISPFVISTNSLYIEGKNETFMRWRKGVESVLWSALGYIIGFSTFALLIPMIYSVNSYVDVGTLGAIKLIGGLGKIISYPLLNSFVKCLWVVTAVTVLERMPKLLLPILTASHGDLNSPHPSIGGGGKKFTDKATAVIGDVKKAAAKIGSVITGKALLGLAQEVKTEALEMIPGYNIGKSIKERYADPIFNKIQDNKAKDEGKEIESLLISYGFDSKTAKAAGDALLETNKKRRKQAADNKKRMEGYRKEFEKLFM